jgi:hypothetical protein
MRTRCTCVAARCAGVGGLVRTMKGTFTSELPTVARGTATRNILCRILCANLMQYDVHCLRSIRSPFGSVRVARIPIPIYM